MGRQVMFRGTRNPWIAPPLPRGGFSYLLLLNDDYEPVKSNPSHVQMISNDILLGEYEEIPWTGGSSIQGAALKEQVGTASTSGTTASNNGAAVRRSRVSSARSLKQAATAASNST